jgi:hypothetical protein
MVGLCRSPLPSSSPAGRPARLQGRRRVAVAGALVAAWMTTPIGPIGATASAPTVAASPMLVLSPSSGTIGQAVVASGAGFPRKSVIRVSWDASLTATATRTSNRGSFEVSIDVPALAEGSHELVALSEDGTPLTTAPFTIVASSSDAPPSPAPTPTPAPTSPGQAVVSFGPNGTQAEFVALMADTSVDVIEIADGTYSGWHIGGSGQPAFTINRSGHPLLVRPAAGATVIFDGAGVPSGDGWFYAGRWTTQSAPVGSFTFQGPFVIQNYALGQQGLVSTYWAEHVAFSGFATRGITGLSGGSTSWQVYVSSDGIHRGSDLTFDDWTVAATPGKNASGLQTYHDPQASGVHAVGWTIDAPHIAILSWGDATGVDVEGWRITNADYPVSTDGVAAGILRNNSATGSMYAPIIKAPFVDGGGNSWH